LKQIEPLHCSGFRGPFKQCFLICLVSCIPAIDIAAFPSTLLWMCGRCDNA